MMLKKICSGRAAVFGTIAAAVFISFAAWGTGISSNSPNATRCDLLAANPTDSDLPDGVDGVRTSQMNAEDAIAACTNELSNQPENSRVTYQLGRALAAAKRFEEAAKRLKQACDLDYAAACNHLGFLYRKGNGVPKSAKRAVPLYEKACDLDYGVGCASLGFVFDEGIGGVLPDGQKAASFYQKACDLKSGIGCSNLGSSYYYGKGGLKSAERAVPFFENACDLDYGQGCNSAGLLYQHADGVPKNLKRATSFYEKACDLDYGGACANLGLLISQIGSGFFERESAFVSRLSKAFQKGCDLGYGPSCGEFARVSRTPFHYTTSDEKELFSKLYEHNYFGKPNIVSQTYAFKGCNLKDKLSCKIKKREKYLQERIIGSIELDYSWRRNLKSKFDTLQNGIENYCVNKCGPKEYFTTTCNGFMGNTRDYTICRDVPRWTSPSRDTQNHCTNSCMIETGAFHDVLKIAKPSCPASVEWEYWSDCVGNFEFYHYEGDETAANKIKYSGFMKDGRPHGRGVIQFSSGLAEEDIQIFDVQLEYSRLQRSAVSKIFDTETIFASKVKISGNFENGDLLFGKMSFGDKWFEGFFENYVPSNGTLYRVTDNDVLGKFKDRRLVKSEKD